MSESSQKQSMIIRSQGMIAQGHSQSAADGGSREDGRGRASEDECDRRCRLLQWRTGRSLRGERNPSSCTQQSRDQQSGRRHILRPHRLPVPGTKRHVCLSGWPDPHPQTVSAQRAVIYAAQPEVCGACALKGRCTARSRRFVTRHLHEAALQGMDQRATPEIMRLRRSTVEHPFATLKYRIFGHPRFLLRGQSGAQTEMSLAVMAYNIKRMFNILGGLQLKASFSIV